MTLAEYSALQLPATPRILGVPLRPFALGHALLLARVGSPFMRAAGDSEFEVQGSKFKVPGLGDLLLALEICRHEPFHLPGRVRLAWLGWLKRNTPEGVVLDACIAFAGYVRAASTVPPTWAPVGPMADAPETMLLQGIKLTLQAELGHTEASALRVPLALALRDCFTLWAADGRVKLKTAADAAAIAHLEKLRAGELRVERPAPLATLSTLNSPTLN